MKRVNIDIRKTVILFVAVHLMIAWVAERKGVRTGQRSFLVKSTDLAGKVNKMEKQYGLMGLQP